MHLLDIHSLQLEDVTDETTKPYCILSHVWEQNQEILYEDINSLPRSSRSGAEKTRSFCKLLCDEKSILDPSALVDRVWVDTCCIDKKSSAELSEAINSMYKYYATAKICVA